MEENDRKLWAINRPNEPFRGATADMHYDMFKGLYELYARCLDEESDD
jgi:hypothetical protein